MDSSSNASSTPEAAPAPARPAAPWWRRVVGACAESLDVIYPPSCVNCHALVEGGDFRYLCESCARRMTPVAAPHCTTCGYPFFGALAENAGCPHCEMLQPVFGEGRTAGLLQGPLRRIVHALKYEQAEHVLRDVEVIVRGNTYFTGFLAGAVLVPVPLHPRKFRERGYNQAELLARVFARAAPGASVAHVLRRVVDTPTQTRLDRAGRQANLKNAFALAKRARVEPGSRYVLVDDVFTTGATLNACAAVLRRAGLSNVDIATLGHG